MLVNRSPAIPSITNKATLSEIGERAKAGDRAALKALQEFLRSNPVSVND
jgi:hypothetical protein